MGHRCEANLEKVYVSILQRYLIGVGIFVQTMILEIRTSVIPLPRVGKRCLKWATVIRNNFAYCKDHDPGECPMTQTREQFIEQFVTQFLASWCAEYYEKPLQ